MSQHTDHVLDAIDGAIDDWETSPDAMRWTTEPEQAPQLPVWTAEDFAQAARVAAQLRETMRQSFARLLEDIAPAFQALREELKRTQPKHEPTDPWERALERQRNRNTGPRRNPHARLGRGSR